MAKKLTITVDDVYEGLHNRIGRRRISRFLNDLARPHVSQADLAAAYREMAADEAREREALEWAEGFIQDIADEPRRAAAARRGLVGRLRFLGRGREQEDQGRRRSQQ